MGILADYVLDGALTKLDEATHIYLCSAEPDTYAEATATYDLGYKNWGAGGAFGAAAAGSPNGRKVPTTAITDGSVTDNGTATHLAAVDTANSRFLASWPLASSQAVTSGNTFAVASHDISIPST